VEADPPASDADPRIRLVEDHVVAESEDSLERMMVLRADARRDHDRFRRKAPANAPARSGRA
jgi:hypothetical protein